MHIMINEKGLSMSNNYLVSSASVALTALFCLSGPSSAQDLTLSLSSQTVTETPTMQYVDMHTVFLLDFSSSVTFEERSTMLSGIYSALLSGEAKVHFSRGLSRAFTVVYFADTAAATQTHIVNNHEEAMQMAKSLLWNPLLEIPAQDFAGVGSNTNMLAGLTQVADIFENERSYGVVSASKSVVAMADDPSQGDHAKIRSLSNMITAVYGATFFCGPVTQQGKKAAVTSFLTEQVQTPEGSIHVDSYGFASAVRPGRTRVVASSGDATKVVAEALNLMGY